MPVQRIIGGIKVQDDLLTLARHRLDSFANQQPFNLQGLGLNLTITLIAPIDKALGQILDDPMARFYFAQKEPSSSVATDVAPSEIGRHFTAL